eukprot:g3986.t1
MTSRTLTKVSCPLCRIKLQVRRTDDAIHIQCWACKHKFVHRGGVVRAEMADVADDNSVDDVLTSMAQGGHSEASGADLNAVVAGLHHYGIYHIADLKSCNTSTILKIIVGVSSLAVAATRQASERPVRSGSNSLPAVAECEAGDKSLLIPSRSPLLSKVSSESLDSAGSFAAPGMPTPLGIPAGAEESGFEKTPQCGDKRRRSQICDNHTSSENLAYNNSAVDTSPQKRLKNVSVSGISDSFQKQYAKSSTGAPSSEMLSLQQASRRLKIANDDSESELSNRLLATSNNVLECPKCIPGSGKPPGHKGRHRRYVKSSRIHKHVKTDGHKPLKATNLNDSCSGSDSSKSSMGKDSSSEESSDEESSDEESSDEESSDEESSDEESSDEESSDEDESYEKKNGGNFTANKWLRLTQAGGPLKQGCTLMITHGRKQYTGVLKGTSISYQNELFSSPTAFDKRCTGGASHNGLKAVKANVDGVWKRLEALYKEMQLQKDEDEDEDINIDLDSNSSKNEKPRKYTWADMVSMGLIKKCDKLRTIIGSNIEAGIEATVGKGKILYGRPSRTVTGSSHTILKRTFKSVREYFEYMCEEVYQCDPHTEDMWTAVEVKHFEWTKLSELNPAIRAV